MRQRNWLAFAIVVALIAFASSSVRAASPPNIVLIISDDQSWTDYGFMGHAHIETPNLDRLAADSVTFRRGYVPTALCRPSLMPHVPHTPPKRLRDKYSRVAGLTRQTAGYYAMCEWFDETCGQLIAYLEKKGVRDNTLIVYVTDNGWIQHPNAGHHLTRSKASPYEGGIRTPIMFSWPDKLKPADRDEIVSSIDIMPTILAAAGARMPTDLPGLNLLDNLAAGTPIQREMIFGENFAHNIADIEDPEASLTFRWCIASKWKLLLTYDGEVVRTQPEWDSRTVTGPQLFDLLADPHEKHNLAASHPDVVARLAREIANWYPVTKRKTEESISK